MKINKYKITAVLFLVIIFWIGTVTLWNNRTEFKNMLHSGDVINETNKIYSENVAYSDTFIDMWSKTQSVTDVQLLDDAEYGNIIKDEKGNLYFPANDVDVTSLAQNTIDFSEMLSEKNIKFAYVQAPNKDLKGYTDKIVSDYNFSNKNADEFLSILDENGVDTLDLRELIIKENLDREKLFYKTDHHWTTTTAFWAYNKLVEYLNQTYNLNIDPNNYYRDINNYNLTEIKECYLGSLGRRVGKSVSGLDDYTFIEPNFKTDYKIYNGVTSKTNPIFKGNFHKAIVKDNILTSNDVTSNKHATYFEWDYGDLIIKNTLIDNDVKILLIKDSYSLPLAAFLSTCVSELDMVDLRDTPKVDLQKKIADGDFDVVLVLYNTEVFNETMFGFDNK